MSAPVASETLNSSQTTTSMATSQCGELLHVIVCGGGVIGCCIAYYLGKKGAKVTVVERTGIACAASGKAGGFLALDMCDGSAIEELARASFALHAELADELGGESYGYRRINSLNVDVEEPQAAQHPSERVLEAGTPAWIDGPIKGTPSSMGTTSTNAQVHPQLFTRAVFSAAQKKYGASLLIGEVQEVKVENKRAVGVVVDGKLIAGNAVVLALGPWSSRNPLISSFTTISALKSQSIVLLPKNPGAISAHALFLQYKTKEGKVIDPEIEIYPRGTGEVYVCGTSEQMEVPDDALKVLPRDDVTAMLQGVASTVSSHLADAEVSVSQACFLPISEDDVPVIGKLPDLEGAFVATGHSCWGILNAPATGSALAELIVDGSPRTCSLKPFDPSRFSKMRSLSQ
ncbi:hypothetical protein M758_6G137300 [Ceratodon purpureus]|nr:hypothetical protein M758_6G137300 [Ceratodon purpureus]